MIERINRSRSPESARNELRRLRERVAGLLERNTSLVHTKRDLEARVKELEANVSHYRGAHHEAVNDKVKFANRLREAQAWAKTVEVDLATSIVTMIGEAALFPR